AMPHAHDFCAMEVESNPVPTKTNPLGVKGAGEAGCVGALPAITNALVDALSEFGVDHIEMPATPERIWRAMQPRERLIPQIFRKDARAIERIASGAGRAQHQERRSCSRSS